MKKFIVIVTGFVFLYFASRILLVWDKPNSDSTDRVSIEIPKGTGLSPISHKLKEKGLIRDDFVFRLFVKWHHLGTRLQAGEYVIQKNLTFQEIVDILQNGKSKEQKITIPEGSTIADIDAILAKKSLIKPGEFQTCAGTCTLSFRVPMLEGYLYPSTYFVNPKHFDSRRFIERLYKNFQIQIAPFKEDIAKSGRTLDEIVRVASMVEREAFGDSLEEKKKIAGIMWKRLDENIPLGIDATTRYELGEWDRPLYTDDFESNSGYNTRRNLGLPPTAISNFSMDAFEAAVRPEKTEYYYYLHDRNGKIHFGKTLEDHNRNKRNYLD